MLKEHDRKNFCYKFEIDWLNTFSVIWVWKLKILQRMYELICAFATQNFFRFLKAYIDLPSFYIQRAENFIDYQVSRAL